MCLPLLIGWSNMPLAGSSIIYSTRQSSYSSSASSEPFLFIATPLHPSPPPLLHQPITPLHPPSPLPLHPSFLSPPPLLPLTPPSLWPPPSPLLPIFFFSNTLLLPYTLLPLSLCTLRFFPLLFFF